MGRMDMLDQPIAAKPRPSELDGIAQLEYVARRIVEGDTARDLSRRLRIPYARAVVLHAEVFAQVYQSIEDAYGKDRLKQEKFALKQSLEQQVSLCKRAVEQSFREGKPNTRPYGHMNTAIKLLNAMGGHNAPVQSVNTDVQVYAAFQPKDMGRVLANPEARRAMLEFERAVGSLGDEVTPAPIDVTPPWEDLPAGGDA